MPFFVKVDERPIADVRRCFAFRKDGGLNIGGGSGIVPEGPIPDGSISQFARSCTGSSCTIGPTSSAPPVNTAAVCSDGGKANWVYRLPMWTRCPRWTASMVRT
jgi:hypothetical protein